MKFSPERKKIIGFSLIIPFCKAPEFFSFRNYQRSADIVKMILNTTENLDPCGYIGGIFLRLKRYKKIWRTVFKFQSYSEANSLCPLISEALINTIKTKNETKFGL